MTICLAPLTVKETITYINDLFADKTSYELFVASWDSMKIVHQMFLKASLILQFFHMLFDNITFLSCSWFWSNIHFLNLLFFRENDFSLSTVRVIIGQTLSTMIKAFAYT